MLAAVTSPSIKSRELNRVSFFLLLKVPLAEKTAVLFTKDGDQHNNLHDMQCMWFVSSGTIVCFHDLSFWWRVLTFVPWFS